MSISIFIVLIILSSAIITDGHPLINSEQLMPSSFSSFIVSDSDFPASSDNNLNALLYLTERIIK